MAGASGLLAKAIGGTRPDTVAAPEHPSDFGIYRRALGVGVAGVVVVLLVVMVGVASGKRGPRLARFAVPDKPAVSAAPAKLTLEPLTAALRRKGFHECNPHDPLGLGPYRPYRNVSMGQILVPQEGGHTADMGYDVIVHFHGHEPARKILVQVARGVVFVGIDKGLGSGPYADAFQNPDVFPTLRRSITHALQAESGDDRAHIRHLALSAWSAGYGAVNEILKHGDEGIDAVVLLDGLHAGWTPGHKHDHSVAAADSAYIQPIFDFAKRALQGEKIFIFTHSQVDPVTYPSTTQTSALLLSKLGLTVTPHDPGDEPYGLTGTVDVKGFHVWAYRGRDEDAHCSHLTHFARAVRDYLEPAWNTPAMDRDVPPTAAPKLGGGETDAGTEPPASDAAPPATEPAADAGRAGLLPGPADSVPSPAARPAPPPDVPGLPGITKDFAPRAAAAAASAPAAPRPSGAPEPPLD